MTSTPLFNELACKFAPEVGDDTLAFLATKLGAGTFTVRTPGGDLSLTDREGLLSHLKNRETEGDTGGVEVAGPVVPRTGRRGRRGQVREIGGVDHVRDPDPAA